MTISPLGHCRPTHTTSNAAVHNNNTLQTDDYLAGAYKSHVRTTPMTFLFPCSMMQYMLTVQLFGITRVCPSCIHVRHMSVLDLEWLRQISPSPWPYNRLQWPRNGFFISSCKAKITVIPWDMFAKNSTISSLLFHTLFFFMHCYLTWVRVSSSAQSSQMLRKTSELRSWRQNVNATWAKLPYGVDSSKIFTVKDVRGLLRF